MSMRGFGFGSRFVLAGVLVLGAMEAARAQGPVPPPPPPGLYEPTPGPYQQPYQQAIDPGALGQARFGRLGLAGPEVGVIDPGAPGRNVGQLGLAGPGVGVVEEACHRSWGHSVHYGGWGGWGGHGFGFGPGFGYRQPFPVGFSYGYGFPPPAPFFPYGPRPVGFGVRVGVGYGFPFGGFRPW